MLATTSAIDVTANLGSCLCAITVLLPEAYVI